jgi:hypothetical protein
MTLKTAKEKVLKKFPDATPVWLLIGWTIWATTSSGYRRVSDGCQRKKYAWVDAAKKICKPPQEPRVLLRASGVTVTKENEHAIG